MNSYLARALDWDYVASAAGRLRLAPPPEDLGPGPARSGEAVLVRVLAVNPRYDRLELADGTTVPLRAGDRFVGVAGDRQALRGYAGRAPGRVRAGAVLDLLSLGGVVGRCRGGSLELGPPSRVELVARLGRSGEPLTLRDGALPPGRPGRGCPIVAVVGTSMSAGKTRASTALVRYAAAAGLRVAAAKLTGVGCLRDTLRMRENGAFATVSFLDAGLVSTVGARRLPAIAGGLIDHLDRMAPDLIVAELGDGLLGAYGVDRLLRSAPLRARLRAVVLSASDHVGAWGACELLRRWRLAVHAVTGPLTDSPDASRFVERRLGVPAVNACTDAERLFATIRPLLPS